jgi:peptidoglycan/xylan/chitin deacetylase (PgdA/CDA1 family)
MNWVAALKLPFVHMGYADDFWGSFVDHYLELEKGICSTFFVIPFKGRPGRRLHGPAPLFRAARYGAEDIAEAVRKIVAAGSEVALHGIDAWLDSSSGRAELEEIRRLTGTPEIGVRMHWLYYDQESPLTLERAGAAYDSTVGYTDTVGYRAGTTQAFMPLQATRLLELPMHVMDTALFYPDSLGLSAREASPLLARILDDVSEFGGCMTINWHDRSLAPERLWCEAYRDLVQNLKSRGAWFATAGQAVSWFRKRRSATFEMDGIELEAGREACDDGGQNLPGLQVRIHNPRESGEIGCQAQTGFPSELGQYLTASSSPASEEKSAPVNLR